MAEAAMISALVVSTAAGVAGTQAQLEAQKKEKRANQRIMALETQKRVRQAFAARRIQEAGIISASESEGARSSSAVSGAVGALRSDVAGNIGAANTRMAAQNVVNSALYQGAKKAGTFDSIGAVADNTLGFIKFRQSQKSTV